MFSKYTNLYFPICSFVISIVTTCFFFSKKNIKTKETTIYSKLLIVGLLESTLYSFICLIAHFYFNDGHYYLFQILNKILYSIYIIWFSLLTYYFINIYLTNKKELKIPYLSKYIILCLAIIFITLIWILNVDIYYNPTSGMSNSSGSAANILYIGISLYIILMIIIALLDIKSNKSKKYIPLYLLIILMIFTLFIRKKDPLFSIYSNVLSLTLLVMYFTIENPDLKMLTEFNKNKKLIELNIEEKSNSFFKISQEIKSPLRKINLISSNIIKNEKNKNIKENAQEINILSKNIMDIVDDVLNISELDTKNIKIMENNYNTYNLFTQIIINIKKEMPQNINFIYNISNYIPKQLYGDQIRIKQIIYSIISICKKSTTKGFIDLNIEAIIKFNACRLIIKISDSGKNIDIEKIHNILKNEYNLNNQDIKDLNNYNLNLETIKKIIDILNGNFLIRNNDKKGKEFIIIIDQIIKDDENLKEKSIINTLADKLSNKKKILLIDDNYQTLKIINKELEKYNLDITSSVYGEDLITKIENGEKYNLILIDDEMEPKNAVEIMKKISNKNLKIIIMLEKNKEIIKRKYLKDYSFTDYLLKSNYQEEIKRIVNKYL